MNNLLLLSFLGICMFPANDEFTITNKSEAPAITSVNSKELKVSGSPNEGCFDMMPAVEFKNQQYCRVEVPDFEFDAKFNIVGASVLFSGAGFERGVIKAELKTSSLQPISTFMKQCKPGSIIIFEKIKVVGPDNVLRVIPGKSIKLY